MIGPLQSYIHYVVLCRKIFLHNNKQVCCQSLWSRIPELGKQDKVDDFFEHIAIERNFAHGVVAFSLRASFSLQAFVAY